MTTTARACTVDGCPRPYLARGYCNTHHTQWKRGRNPHQPRGPLSPAEVVRLRRILGLPDDGPTPAQHARWLRQEARP